MKGILTTDTDSPVSKTSAVRETYKSPEGPKMRMNGSRREALQKSLYEMVAKEVEEEFHPPPPPVELISTTQHDYSLGELFMVGVQIVLAPVLCGRSLLVDKQTTHEYTNTK